MNIATLRQAILQESTARIEIGTVVSADVRGTTTCVVRLSGGSVCTRTYNCVEGLEPGDEVIVAHLEGKSRLVIIARIMTAYGSLYDRRSILSPPDNLATRPVPGAIWAEWDAYPGATTLCWQVQHHDSDSDDANATDAIVTMGSYFLYRVVDADTDLGTPVTRYFRVRAIRWISDNNVMYSSWSAWVSGTSVTWDGRYYAESELSSASCDGAHGASLIWICDADDNFPSTVSNVEQALDYVWDNAGGAAAAHDVFSATHTDTVAGAVLQGYVMRGNATPAWERHDASGDHLILVGDGNDIASKAFDWDDIAAGVAADMVHDHSSAAEGDEIPPTSLGSYVQGSVIRGGAADWEAHDAKTDHFILIGDGTDIVSKAFDWDDLSVGAGADMVHDHCSAAEGGTIAASCVWILDSDDNFISTISNVELALDYLAETGSTHNLLSATHPDTVVNAPTRGSLVYGNATSAWDELILGADGAALTSNGIDIAWDSTPLWKGIHTHEANIVLDDGVSDSPQVQFIGGSNDDTISIFLLDDAVANDSDLVIRLCATDDDSRLVIQDSVGANQVYIDADGNADFSGHMALGGAGVVSAGKILHMEEKITANTGSFYALQGRYNFNPTANFNTGLYGNRFIVTIGTSKTRTGGEITGIEGRIFVTNTKDPRDLVLYGGSFRVDVEDAGSGAGVGAAIACALRADMPDVDTGVITDSYGLKVVRATIGAGSIVNQYGIHMEDIENATNNYAIRTSLGDIRFGDAVLIDGSGAADVQLTVQGAAAQAANLQEWEDSAAAILLSVSAAGSLIICDDGVIGVGDAAGAGLVFDTTPHPDTITIRDANLLIEDGATIGQTAGPLLTFDDTNNYLEITGCTVGIGITPTVGYRLEVVAPGDHTRLALGDSTANKSAQFTLRNSVSDWSVANYHTTGDFNVLSGVNARLNITAAGVTKIPNLAGVGVRNVVAAADGTLSAP